MKRLLIVMAVIIICLTVARFSLAKSRVMESNNHGEIKIETVCVDGIVWLMTTNTRTGEFEMKQVYIGENVPKTCLKGDI